MTPNPVTANPVTGAQRPVVESIVSGALAGLIGGLAFGAAMAQLGLLPSIALLIRSESATIGFFVHLLVAVIIGSGFSLFVRFQRPEIGETLFWGLIYGGIWWFLGAATLLPALTGQAVAWSVEPMRALLPALIGHLVYGAITSLALVVILRRNELQHSISRGVLIRGSIAGLLSSTFLALTLNSQTGSAIMSASVSNSMTTVSGPLLWLSTIVVGIAAGVGFAVLFPTAKAGLGPTAIRGLAYGFLWWILLALTVLPLVDGRDLSWSVAEIRQNFASFPGYLLLLGTGLALIYHGLSAVQQALFTDAATIRSQEGLGAQGLRAIGQGAISGFVGGLVFTIIMVQIGFLSTVSQLLGRDSALLGFVVHLVIANIIGIAYGIAFVRRSNDYSSALGWGVSYGVLWWFLGPLTLLPLLLGDTVQWSIAASTDAYPALVGHIVYGAVLGVGFFRLEKRHNPWWITRNRAEALRASRADQNLRGSAPALWSLTILIALVVPILLG